MRRKPAIILFLLLFLSIGGAVLHYQLHKERPPEYGELDAFLRDLPASSGRVLHFHQSFPGGKQRNRGWWDVLRIRREDYVQSDMYYIRKIGDNDAVPTFGTTTNEMLNWIISHPEEFKKDGATLVLSTRRNGKIDRVGVIGSSGSEDFIIARFPKLRPYLTQQPPP